MENRVGETLPRIQEQKYLSYLISHHKNGSDNQLKSPFKRHFNAIVPSTKDNGTSSKTIGTQHYNGCELNFNATAKRKVAMEHYTNFPEKKQQETRARGDKS